MVERDIELIIKDDGYPVTALLEGLRASIISPPKSGAWICIQLHCHAHEPQDVQSRYAEFLPPAISQIALDPSSAHAFGRYLIQKAQEAVEVE